MERGRNRCRSHFFQILDIWSHSVDRPIRDRSRKLSKMALNFGRFFSPSQILWGRPSKSYTNVMTHASWHVLWKMFCGDTPTSPEVIVANTLNFKPNFKFSGLKFFGATPVPLRVCAIKVWSISSAYKIFRAQHPLWAENSLPKKCILVGPNSHGIPSCYSGPKFTGLFSSNAGGIAITLTR